MMDENISDKESLLESTNVNEILPDNIISVQDLQKATLQQSRHTKRRRVLTKEPVATEVTFHNVSYWLRTKIQGHRIVRVILKEVNGILKTGLNAILGPTGSGKTTLLDVLAGRKDKRFLIGDILVNGNRQPDKFKLISGYVVQDDVVMGTLTVRENLLFSAALRLPKKFKLKDRECRVEMVLRDLGLDEVADSKVGTELIRGISGGERKRTNIGMELITSPDVLFLDEPTTGLDSATAYTIMKVLHNQGMQGRTIICSIHQPRYSIYKLFDSLTLLSAGEIVYHGPNLKALSYFNDLGYVCEAHNNPPDFFLDIISEESWKVKDDSKDADSHSIQFNANDVRGPVSDALGEVINFPGPGLADLHRGSSCFTETMQNLRPTLEALLKKEEAGIFDRADSSIGYQTSFFRQLGLCSKRAMLNILRNPKTGVAQVFVNMVYACIIGTIFYQLDLSGDNGLQNRVGVFFFIVMSMVFGNMNAVELFIKDRRIFVHESSNGYYRVSSYFFSKILCDIIPMRTFPIMVFSGIAYWMIGLRKDIFKFLFFFLNLLLTSFCACSVSFVISSSVKFQGIATLLTVLIYTFMMLFGGLLANVKTMSSWLRWLKYLSIFRYSLANLDIIELDGLKFHCAVNSTTCVTNGDHYLQSQGITVDKFWYHMIALGAMTVILMFLAYIQLRRIKKEK